MTALLAAPAPSRIPASFPHPAGVQQAEEKSSLAVRRRAGLGLSLVLRESLSLMQSSPISPSTAKEYVFYYNKIVEWEMMNLGHQGTSESSMTWVLTAMLGDWYLEGERLNACKKAVAALVFFRPHFGRGAGWLFELHAPSKTQEYGESILLDKEYALFFGPLLAQLGARNAVMNQLFTITKLQLGHCFRAACECLRLVCRGSPTPCQLCDSVA